MRIALYGGTFDPPHLAHQRIAEAALEEVGLDQVWWIPCGKPPHKPGAGITPFAHRLAMARLAVAHRTTFRVMDFEGHRDGLSYTVDTVEAVLSEYPQDAFWLLMGEDSLEQLHTWKAPGRIARLVPMIVYRRSGRVRDSVQPHPAANVHYLAAPLLDLASNTIRARVAQNFNISDFVRDSVRAYINDNGLYRIKL